ncbi:rhomboid family intramembrane serine protease [Kushneria aurantia]|uniref:Rhomboid family intramembrane serine protease n=1 Tax=Kushneria aurantia TaxID=504092 RepID=A0ABV6G6B4_9GAMM|nr:rhomboid family intramembrane serine protease [Kushneria aurantia]
MTLTILLIVVTCAVSIPAFSNRRLLEALLFWPPAIGRGQLYRFVTHGFVHADGRHLLFNMVTLFFFGRAIESFFVSMIGAIGFVAFYLGGIVVAILPSYLAHRSDNRYRSLGASGAVSAVLFAFILAAPWSTLYVFVVPVPAIVFALLYTAWSIYAGRRGGDGVNHSAHLWGGAYGVAFMLWMAPQLGPRFMEQLLSP